MKPGRSVRSRPSISSAPAALMSAAPTRRTRPESTRTERCSVVRSTWLTRPAFATLALALEANVPSTVACAELHRDHRSLLVPNEARDLRRPRRDERILEGAHQPIRRTSLPIHNERGVGDLHLPARRDLTAHVRAGVVSQVAPRGADAHEDSPETSR